ncbi:hypothetical protein N8458_00680 [Synechococcus sp. AH-601-P18]|nr:hypothetical protein [Synechococcus sp. AH-601-P18]
MSKHTTSEYPKSAAIKLSKLLTVRHIIRSPEEDESLRNFYSSKSSKRKWLDRLKPEDHLLEIDGDLNIEPIYAYLNIQCQVTCIASNSVNLQFLLQTLSQNPPSDRIKILPQTLNNERDLVSTTKSPWPKNRTRQVRLPLNELFSLGGLDTPNFIHFRASDETVSILDGASELLQSKALRSILVEEGSLNSAEIKAIIEKLSNVNFYLDPNKFMSTDKDLKSNLIFNRVNLSSLQYLQGSNITFITQPEGDPQAEKAFKQASTIIQSKPLNENPFPYFFAENIFPNNYYAMVKNNFPKLGEMQNIGETGRTRIGEYKERNVLNLTSGLGKGLNVLQKRFWSSFLLQLTSRHFTEALLRKFATVTSYRLAEDLETKNFALKHDVMLVNDQTGFSIGPHTDNPRRLLSLLFYLPESNNLSETGTSLYTPKEPGTICEKGIHHPFTLFNKSITLPFNKNSLLIFGRSNNSFHGVEPINLNTQSERKLLIYNIRCIDLIGNK